MSAKIESCQYLKQPASSRSVRRSLSACWMCPVHTVMPHKHSVCSCLCPLTVTPPLPSSSCQHICQLSTSFLLFSSLPFILLSRKSLWLEVCALHSHSKLYRALPCSMLDLGSPLNAEISVLLSVSMSLFGCGNVDVFLPLVLPHCLCVADLEVQRMKKAVESLLAANEEKVQQFSLCL